MPGNPPAAVDVLQEECSQVARTDHEPLALQISFRCAGRMRRLLRDRRESFQNIFGDMIPFKTQSDFQPAVATVLRACCESNRVASDLNACAASLLDARQVFYKFSVPRAQLGYRGLLTYQRLHCRARIVRRVLQTYTAPPEGGQQNGRTAVLTWPQQEIGGPCDIWPRCVLVQSYVCRDRCRRSSKKLRGPLCNILNGRMLQPSTCLGLLQRAAWACCLPSRIVCRQPLPSPTRTQRERNAERVLGPPEEDFLGATTFQAIGAEVNSCQKCVQRDCVPVGASLDRRVPLALVRVRAARLPCASNVLRCAALSPQRRMGFCRPCQAMFMFLFGMVFERSGKGPGGGPPQCAACGPKACSCLRPDARPSFQHHR